MQFMKKQEDITDRVNTLIAGKNADKTAEILDSLTNAMTAEAKKIDKSFHVEIDPFYEGNKYYATT
ncbi:S46 family peptidase, partial [Brevibacterium sp. UMB10442]|nr:S46 family peptidase [Brevibacterium sp. UMB10442]